MTTVNSFGYHTKPAHAPLSVAAAIRLAWAFWFGLLLIPFSLVLGMLFYVGQSDTLSIARPNPAWFLAAMAYIAVVIPASFFLREHVFAAYWTGKTVSPSRYLFGMVCVWLALETAGVFSVIGCIETKTLMPNLIPSMVLLVYFFTQFPVGRAMIRSTGDQEDSAVYEEPR